MSTIAAYSVESDVAKELKKGSFKLYHQKTPPTNTVLENIHDDDTEEVKRIKRLINEMRLKLGNSTDIIKIEPETTLFNILYTKNEIDQMLISQGSGFNLPLFLHSVLITGAEMTKLRGGEKVNTEMYKDYFNTTMDNFDYVYKIFTDYAKKFEEIGEDIEHLDLELEKVQNDLSALTTRVDNIKECECDHEWMKFMKSNFVKGTDENEVFVNGELDFKGRG